MPLYLRRILASAAVLLLSACAAPQTPEAERASAEAPLDEEGDSDGLLRPDEILRILDRSRIEYEIISEHDVQGGGLADIIDQPVRRTRPIDPFIQVRRGADERLQLQSSRPPGHVREVFHLAGEAFAAQQYEMAAVLYGRAVELDPTYFKSFTYLGNTLYFLGQYTRAEEMFLKALELNPIDYQALLFLGDTYIHLAQYSRAKSVLTRAFMLNRNNEAVADRLKVVLAKLNLRIRPDRLDPRVRIEQVARKSVKLHFDSDSGLRWLALATCMACWAYENECGSRAPEQDDPLRLSMYRECLINQAASIAVRRDRDGDPLRTDERSLLEAIEVGYLEAIIFWEIVAQTAPVVILLLPPQVQEQIEDYILRYVFAPNQLV